MKNILIISIASILTLFIFRACAKEELVVINEPLELDEDSPQYQQYMEERAINLIKLYRFDKLGNTIDRIKDPVVKERVTAMYNEYRNKAFKEAFYFVTPANDSLFFFPATTEKPSEVKFFRINFVPNFWDLNKQSSTLNVRGVLHGLQNYPNTEDLYFTNPLATGLKGLEGMPELKTFTWTVTPSELASRHPDEEIYPVPLEADFSSNYKLESLSFEYIDPANLTFPKHKLKSFTLRSALINTNDNLENLFANQVLISGTSDKESLIFNAKGIDSLQLMANGLKSLDISNSTLLKLTSVIVQSEQNLESVKLNEGLKKLSIRAINLKEKPTFPTSLEDLRLEYYNFDDIDFSSLQNLKRFSISGSESGFEKPGLKLPSNLEYMDFDIIAIHDVHLSDANKLKTLRMYISTVTGNSIELPAGLEKIDISHSEFKTPVEMDLSQLDNIKFLRLGMTGISKLILPVNLSEDAVKAGGYVNQGGITLSKETIIINKPAWFDQYVNYTD